MPRDEGKSARSKRFRVIRGELSRQSPRPHPVHVFLGPRGDQPFPVDAVVLEEDTFLVLSAPPQPTEPQTEHPIRMMTALMEVEPRPPGSIVVRERTPVEILAIVHDLDSEPSWREEWIAEALDHVFAECERRRITHLGLEMLGTVHGSLQRPRFLQVLRRALARTESKTLERVWLIAPE